MPPKFSYTTPSISRPLPPRVTNRHFVLFPICHTAASHSWILKHPESITLSAPEWTGVGPQTHPCDKRQKIRCVWALDPLTIRTRPSFWLFAEQWQNSIPEAPRTFDKVGWMVLLAEVNHGMVGSKTWLRFGENRQFGCFVTILLQGSHWSLKVLIFLV